RLISGCPYRVDQVAYPMFKRDVEDEKTMTRDQAQELCELMRIKYNELGAYRASVARRVNQGAGMTLIWTLGGVKEDGSDACNELTNVLIDACRSIRTNQPSLALRYHPNMSEKTMHHAFECIRAGLSMPSFHSDEYAIKQLMANGASLEEARNWGLVLCQSPGCQGSKGTRVRNAYDIMPAKCLELALSDGYDYFFSKKQAGVHTGDATKFESFDDVWNAFTKQMEYAISIGSRQKIMTRVVEAEWFKQPFLSSMWEQCVERGVDGIEWEEISNPWFNLIGLVDAADSMSSLDKLVFIDKKYTMEQVITAIRANWEGYEDMRQDFENVPKYGNDDDFADSFMGKILDWTTAYGKTISNYSGGHPRPLPQAVSGFWAYGIKTGALPNGRHEGDVIADGGCSPYHAYDKNGPTAVVASAAKFNHEQLKGCLMNQRLNQAQLMADNGFDLFNAYVRGVFASGLSQVQFNVVDNKVLRSAQKEPDQYPDLVVRVAGYSAYFTELNRKTQDGIISRTEQKLA
ncbi:MAG: glycyl radical protein, partial [Lachnospiraceae bacterium]|nr:glycyl radical protein [Lachnospiraceae bacterium]